MLLKFDDFTKLIELIYKKSYMNSGLEQFPHQFSIDEFREIFATLTTIIHFKSNERVRDICRRFFEDETGECFKEIKDDLINHITELVDQYEFLFTNFDLENFKSSITGVNKDQLEEILIKLGLNIGDIDKETAEDFIFRLLQPNWDEEEGDDLEVILYKIDMRGANIPEQMKKVEEYIGYIQGKVNDVELRRLRSLLRGLKMFWIGTQEAA